MRALRAQLAVVMGKTHMVELAFGGLGTNEHWGTPRNPWDRAQHRVPGGSSAGAGVSLVEGSALIAFGTDTAGSVRIPASMTGTVGLKTTVGRWSTQGVLPLSSTFDTVGILARTVRDAAFAFDGIEAGLLGAHAGHGLRVRELAGCRFGVPEHFFWEGLCPGIADAVRTAIHELEAAGAVLVALELEATEEAHALFLQGGLAGIEVAAFLSRELPDRVEHLDPAVRDRIQASETMPATEYLRRCSRFTALSHSARESLATVDALLTPTVAISPPLVSDLQDLENYRRCNLLALRNTAMANLLSLCALSVPVGLDALGLPVGLQLIAAPGRDRALLQVGVAVERVLGTALERLPRNF
jgi:aspartyl-tRNA(Asn)/glutamyl-tRNA(Gln) amidotransferase subunit A